MPTIAETLNAARLAKQAVVIDPADFPTDEAGVVAIQNAVFEVAGTTPGGWKAGPPPAGMQDTGCAALAAEWTTVSPATVECPGAPLLVESEFVLRFGKDVTPAGAPYTAESIAGYIDGLAPGIELVWRRTANAQGPETALLYQADANGHAGMILGPWREDWQSFDLSGHPVTQHRNGEVHAEGDSGKTMDGHPLNVAAALANREARLGNTIRAGVWVTTGSCTGALEIAAGDVIRSEYGELGVVEVTIR